jgi:glycosyltransferase involved in cell wall biosynthesis
VTNFYGNRLLVRGPFDTVSGYGNDLVGIARNLIRLRGDVHISPTAVMPPIPADIAHLLTRQPETPFDIALLHVDPAQLEVPAGIRHASRRVVGWTMWEWAEFRHESKETLTERLKDFDVLLTYDDVSTSALAPFVPDNVLHKQLQGGFESDDWSVIRDRDWTDTFRFGMLGRLTDRKNPFAAIKAYSLLKERHGDAFDAELHIKTNYRFIHPMVETVHPGVHLYAAWWSTHQIRDFYANIHCLVCPSRGEGKNIPALEAQSTGVPVIASAYSGHMNWLSSQYAYPLDVNVVETEMGPCADVDIEVLADLMWHVYTHREEARQKGELASSIIPRMCDWENVLEKFFDIVKDAPSREPISPP